MEKKGYQYRLTLEMQKKPNNETIDKIPLELEFQNHDNIFRIIEMLKSKELFENPNDNVEFALGLKLFSEVMLRNRDFPLFEEFSPAFDSFMKKLKGKL